MKNKRKAILTVGMLLLIAVILICGIWAAVYFHRSEAENAQPGYSYENPLISGDTLIASDGGEAEVLLIGDGVIPADAPEETLLIFRLRGRKEEGIAEARALYDALNEAGRLETSLAIPADADTAAYIDESCPGLARAAAGGELRDFYFAALLGSPVESYPFRAVAAPFGDPFADGLMNMGTVRVLDWAHDHDIAMIYTVSGEANTEYLTSVYADILIDAERMK